MEKRPEEERVGRRSRGATLGQRGGGQGPFWSKEARLALRTWEWGSSWRAGNGG